MQRAWPKQRWKCRQFFLGAWLQKEAMSPQKKTFEQEGISNDIWTLGILIHLEETSSSEQSSSLSSKSGPQLSSSISWEQNLRCIWTYCIQDLHFDMTMSTLKSSRHRCNKINLYILWVHELFSSKRMTVIKQLNSETLCRRNWNKETRSPSTC